MISACVSSGNIARSANVAIRGRFDATISSSRYRTRQSSVHALFKGERLPLTSLWQVDGIDGNEAVCRETAGLPDRAVLGNECCPGASCGEPGNLLAEQRLGGTDGCRSRVVAQLAETVIAPTLDRTLRPRSSHFVGKRSRDEPLT